MINKQILKFTATALTALLLSTSAQATLWNITNVRDGSNFNSGDISGLTGTLTRPIYSGDVSALGGTFDDTTRELQIGQLFLGATQGISYLGNSFDNIDNTFDSVFALKGLLFSSGGNSVSGFLNFFDGTSFPNSGFLFSFFSKFIIFDSTHNQFMMSGNTAIMKLSGNTSTNGMNILPLNGVGIPTGFAMNIEFDLVNAQAAPSPEVTGLMLGGLGLMGLAALRRK